MKIFSQHIKLILFLFIVQTNFIYSQTYNPQTQNRSWNSNSDINTVFLKSNGVNITITPNLKMIQFVDSNGATYGYNGTNGIPTDWTYEISDSAADVPADTTVSGDKKSITFTADPDRDVIIYLKVSDTNGVVANLSRVQLTLYVRGKLTVATAKWNACEQAYILSVNEQVVNSAKVCSPYRIIVYKVLNGAVDTNTVIYDSNSDNNHDPNNNRFSLSIGVGSYAAIITNSCNETVNSAGDGYYYFSITDAYSFGATALFSGFECITDSVGKAIIKVEGAAKPITWTLKDSNGTEVVNNSSSNQFSLDGYNDNFDIQNFTITIPNLAQGTYTFTFTDGNSCTEEITVKIEKPAEALEVSVLENNSPLSCNGDSDGKFTFIASGGWTEPWSGNYINPNGWGNPYIFTLTKGGVTYSSGDVLSHFVNGTQTGYKTSFTGLSAGTYTLTIRENIATNPFGSNTIYYCEKQFAQTFTITEPAQLTSSGSITNIACNGNNTGSIDLSVSGGTTNYTYAWTKTGDASFNETTQDISGLSPGEYKVTVTDAKNCTTTNSFTITQPAELTIADAALPTAIACFGDNGQIKVNITQASVANYKYDLIQGGSVVQTITNSNLNHTFSAPAGTYKVRVTDANGCFKETNNITLTQPSAGLSISNDSLINITCNGDDDGSIGISVAGGTTNYTYAWTKTGDPNFNETTQDLSGLSPGTYNITVTDAKSCTKQASYTITQPDVLAASGSISNFNGSGVSCNSANDGSIDLSVSGGTTNYTYAWTKTGDASFSKTTQDISGLSSGEYNVTVTDAKNCTDTKSFTITQPDELTIADAALPTAIACFGDNGQIKVNITQASLANYKYDLYQGGSVVQTITNSNLNHTFSAPAGTYKVRVTDANDCFKETNNITLTQPSSGISVSEAISSHNGFNITCNGADDGSIDVTVSGGTLIGSGNYTYAWTKTGDPSFSETTQDLSDLSPGEYKLIVTDNNSCTINKTYTITEPAALAITETISSHTGFGITCNGAKDGSIDITVTGGTSTYTYAWTTVGGSGLDANTEDQTGLGPGTYKVEITDTNSCTIDKTYTITEPAALGITDIVSSHNGFSITCNGANDGSVDITVTGGTSTYTYAWTKAGDNSFSKTTQDLSSLSPGTYNVTVTDSNGCKISDSFVMTEPPAMILTSISSDFNGFNISCNGADDGSIDATVSGGTPIGSGNYTYAWTKTGDPNFSETTQDLSDLSPGEYKLIVTDNNSCTIEKTHTITEPAALAITETISSHTGFGITCNGVNDGSIDITVTGGTSTYTYAWTTVGGSGLDANTEDQTGLGPGTYKVEITDTNSCTIDKTYTITEPDALDLSQTSSDFNGFDASCSGAVDATIDLTITGGAQPYSYAWTTVGGSGLDPTAQDQTGLSAGTYNVTVTDSNGCKISDSFVMTEPPPIILTSSLSDFNGFNISCNGEDDGSIDITVSGGTVTGGDTDYTYAWTKTGDPNFSETTQDLSGLTVGTYIIKITDSNNCSLTTSIPLVQPDVINMSAVLSDYNTYNISVSGGSDGFINVTPLGGSGGYVYAWTKTGDPNFSKTTQDLSGLTVGTYTLKLTDSNGCNITKSFTLDEPTELLLDLGINATNILCYGDKTGSMTAIITQGSVPSYKYTLNGTDYEGNVVSETVSSTTALNYTFLVKAGTYTITVEDLNGGTKTSASRTYTQPAAALAISDLVSNFNGFNISCTGASDASIDVTVTGGTLSGTLYTYTWSTINGSGLQPNIEDQTGLGPGDYDLIVTDDNSCTITKTYTITEPEPIEYKLENKKDISCNGANDGAIDITFTKGTGAYTYAWTKTGDPSFSETTQDLSGLSPGTYKLIFTDGCQTLQYIYEIKEPEVLKIELNDKTDILCHGDTTGKILVTVSGGTSPYNYEWKDQLGNTYNRDIGNVFNKGDLSNIPSGIYDLTVTDKNGCQATLKVELKQPDDLIVNVSKVDVTCFNGSDGSITVTASGGVVPYTYSWSDFGNGATRTDLAAGKYTVKVTDFNNCEESVEVEILAGPKFDVSSVVTPITCFGANDGSIKLTIDGGKAPVTLTWADDPVAGTTRSNLKSGVYSVLIKDSSGCEINEIYTITEPAKLQLSAIKSDALDCDNPNSGSIDLQVIGGNPPYTYAWSSGETTEDLIDIPPNNYTVLVTDSKGCKVEKTFAIVRPFEITVDLTTSLRVICETRDVYQVNKVTIDGGVFPYTIKWSDGDVAGANGEIMETNKDGSYSVEVTDNNGCSKSIIFDVKLPVLGYPEFDYTSFYLQTFNALTFNDPITFTNNSTENYLSVSWDFGDGTSSTQNDPVHTYQKRGWYDVTLYVTYFSGCIYSIKKTIYIGDSYELEIPNAFTPNSDGSNDTFRPVYYGFKNVHLKVFDTWGTLIYSETDEKNIMNGWNGKIFGVPATNGNYIYQVTGEAYNGESVFKNGPFTLLR